ncbi:Diadenosine tetraphosphate (Ap4A) hydrolase [Algoriphagus faecimaris]|uniref:Diadenosine tetraphosphate (Ap4A) hydrolase n=1 Tax=Algoriphagus faecimaris TaxID=686796 RepID=A0A1G6R019_9BACT|nr:HIT family protein [Algoriphagus faecimaris]SDC97841.1 Diadenosine tetraphosphate (Ap4A) hydrolase [Algoriphagus faecimaris]
MSLKQNNFSHLTAKERSSLSFPAKRVKEMTLLNGEILDFGCGFGKDVEILSQQGFSIEGYDRHYQPDYPKKRYDTIICFYVLNVLMPEEQSLVLMEISALLKPSGKAYFAVRRDLIYEGFRTHKIHQKPTYQTNVILPFKSVFKNEFCEIYEYGHFYQSKKDDVECPFCNPSSETELILESAQAFSILDRYPVNPGHALIIPKRHISNYFELSFKEQSSCIFMLNEVKKVIQRRYKPDGFNLGINIGENAGQTVSHVHIHLIPRYTGDVEDPRGGVRGVIPGKSVY